MTHTKEEDMEGFVLGYDGTDYNLQYAEWGGFGLQKYLTS